MTAHVGRAILPRVLTVLGAGISLSAVVLFLPIVLALVLLVLFLVVAIVPATWMEDHCEMNGYEMNGFAWVAIWVISVGAAMLLFVWSLTTAQDWLWPNVFQHIPGWESGYESWLRRQ